MKKLLWTLSIFVLFTSSCATIAGGKVTTYQRTKPKAGEPQRQVRLVALICDIVFWGGAGLIVDFATGAIYKPAPSEKKVKFIDRLNASYYIEDVQRKKAISQ